MPPIAEAVHRRVTIGAADRQPPEGRLQRLQQFLTQPCAGGDGRVFLDDRGFDDSVGDWVVDRFAGNSMAGFQIIVEDAGGRYGASAGVQSQDAFGNLEVTPPIDGYPFGRIYYGASGGGLDPQATRLFEILEETGGMSIPLREDRGRKNGLRRPDRAARIYGADLLGSGTGAALAFAILEAGGPRPAVALAAALGAVRCEILKDVDGVMTADPREVPDARKHDHLDWDEMKQVAASGSGVVHIRAVEYAAQHEVPLVVRSSFHDGPGTIVGPVPSTGSDLPCAPCNRASRYRPLVLNVDRAVGRLRVSADGPEAARDARDARKSKRSWLVLPQPVA